MLRDPGERGAVAGEHLAMLPDDSRKLAEYDARIRHDAEPGEGGGNGDHACSHRAIRGALPPCTPDHASQMSHFASDACQQPGKQGQHETLVRREMPDQQDRRVRRREPVVGRHAARSSLPHDAHDRADGEKTREVHVEGRLSRSNINNPAMPEKTPSRFFHMTRGRSASRCCRSGIRDSWCVKRNDVARASRVMAGPEHPPRDGIRSAMDLFTYLVEPGFPQSARYRLKPPPCGRLAALRSL